MYSPYQKARRPLQLIHIVQFGGATSEGSVTSTSSKDSGASTFTAHGLSGDDGALTSTGHGFSGDDGSLTSTGHGFSGDDGALTSTGHGFSGDYGVSTSTGHGFSGDDGALTSTGHGFSGDDGASTPTADSGALTSTGHGFFGDYGASTSTGHGFSGDDGASTSTSDSGASTADSGASSSTEDEFYGPAGAAALILVKDVEDRDEHAVVMHRFRQGLGNQTINVADYRGLILGLAEAIRKGYTKIIVQGNSELVINQFQGIWEIHEPELWILCDEALLLRNSFESFSINHIDENLSSTVDAEAVQAISLQDGEVEEEPPL
ncbi:unnamed protein product [Vicia faba]|uniref:RNase H type-1 domain-containing protein n=1 Tax=Vicia faba TaxID=3906 RepID=A0AAV1BBQ4_VICFA|nr:unnamed protein product [Vicia faba]